MNNGMDIFDLLDLLVNDAGINDNMITDDLFDDPDFQYLLEQCNAGCAWLDKVRRTKNINHLARGSLLKSRAGAYAGHYISDSALALAARYMGFKILREGDEYYLNISKRSIPDCDGAFPPGSVAYLRKFRTYHNHGLESPSRREILPNWYRREW